MKQPNKYRDDDLTIKFSDDSEVSSFKTWKSQGLVSAQVNSAIGQITVAHMWWATHTFTSTDWTKRENKFCETRKIKLRKNEYEWMKVHKCELLN